MICELSTFLYNLDDLSKLQAKFETGENSRGLGDISDYFEPEIQNSNVKILKTKIVLPDKDPSMI